MGKLSLPFKTSKQFLELIDVTDRYPSEFPHLRPTMLAQMALESGWGTSALARDHYNFSGMKWREMMNGYATPVVYKAWDGTAKYCKFENAKAYWDGYWHRLDANTAYDGWRDHTNTGDAFIGFIGPIWLGLSAKQNCKYVQEVLNIRQQNFGE